MGTGKPILDLDPTSFYDHLDECEQCNNHPFNLCATGQAIMKQMMDGATVRRSETKQDLENVMKVGKP